MKKQWRVLGYILAIQAYFVDLLTYTLFALYINYQIV